MKSFLTALQFLTRIHLRQQSNLVVEDFGRSTKFFPLVGLVLGLIYLLASWCLIAVFGWANFVTTILVLLPVLFTGGLLLDGFMDTVDGVFSGRERERQLEIMKDSRVGAFGVVAMILLVLWKWSLIHDMPASLLAPALISMMAFGRFGMVLVILRFPYAREEGMGKAFSLYAGRRSLWIAVLTVLLLLAALWLFSGALVAGCAAVAALASAGFALLFGSWLTGKLGGLTGDMYGAATELAEVVVLLIFVLSAYVR